jgi:hypothetical protein
MAELIKSLRSHHFKRTLHILAHIILFAWIVSLVMHTKEMQNDSLISQYGAIAIYCMALFRYNQNFLSK